MLHCPPVPTSSWKLCIDRWLFSVVQCFRPDDWVMSELITLPKVTGTFECDKHRTISLISHAAKIALKVIRLRVNHFIAPHIAEEQFGFVSGKGTTDAIIVLRNIIEKAVKRKGAKLWILFVDYAKVFDTVNHDALWNTLREFCVPQRLIWLMQKLYSTGVLRIAGEHTDQIPFEKGVRQGCVLSPMLFNTCGEMIMRMLKCRLHHWRKIGLEFKIRGRHDPNCKIM